MITPTTNKIGGTMYTSQFRPVRGGSDKTRAPYWSTKYCLIWSSRPAGRQFLTDQGAPLGAGLGRADIQRGILAHRAEQLLGNAVNIIIRGGGVLREGSSHPQSGKNQNDWEKPK